MHFADDTSRLNATALIDTSASLIHVYSNYLWIHHYGNLFKNNIVLIVACVKISTFTGIYYVEILKTTHFIIVCVSDINFQLLIV